MQPPCSRTLFALLCQQAERHPDRIAVISGARETSYRKLAERAGRIAAGLQAGGIGSGSRVGILIDNRVEWLEAMFGAAALGAVAVPFSTWSKEAELEFLFADAEIDALIAADRVAGQDFAATIATLLRQPERFPQLRTIAILGAASQPGRIAYDELLANEPIASDSASPDDDCFTLYTSGSSARPKAVRLCHGSTIENGFAIGERMRLSPDDRVLLAPPLFWSYGAANALPATLTHGATLVLQSRFEPGEWIGLVERHHCTATYTLPSMTGAVLRHAEFRRERVASLRTGLMIGSAEEVRIAAEELGAADICNIYGATETYGNCCVTPCDWPLPRRMVSQGPPLPGNTLRIVDAETGAVLAAGEIGLVEVKGHVTPGYAGASAELNSASFTADGYFRTGDLGVLDEAGEFHFVGRDSDVIKRAGINVSPAEVEGLLLQHPHVAQAAVVGAAAGERGEDIVAFVVPHLGDGLDVDVLRAHCRALASSYKVPDRFEICAALPVTETGKLFRRALKDRAAAMTASACGDDSA
jgi:fatty-acyl-CoA synthase